MDTVLSSENVAALRKRLEAREAELLDEVRRELIQSDNERYVDLAERVHDAAEESVADLLSDVELAVIDRHVHELQDIEAARQRIAMGSYGTCQDCDGPIEVERLDAYPTAKRCYGCQRRHEETHAVEGHPRL